jgi:cell division septation protein DedD
VELPKVSIAEKKGEPRESGEEPSKVSVLLAQALKREAPQGEFTLQISAFSVTDSLKVEKALRKWSDSGLSPWIREVQIAGKGRWYRVYEGGFENRAEAEKSGSRLKSEGSIASFVVTKQP